MVGFHVLQGVEKVNTAVRVDTNNTPDSDMLEEDVPELPKDGIHQC